MAGRSGDSEQANASATFKRRSSSLRRLCMRVCRTRRHMPGSTGRPIARPMNRAISSAWLKPRFASRRGCSGTGGQHFGHFHAAPLDFRSNAFGYGVAKRTRQVHAPAEFQPQQQSVHRIVIGKRNNPFGGSGGGRAMQRPHMPVKSVFLIRIPQRGQACPARGRPASHSSHNSRASGARPAHSAQRQGKRSRARPFPPMIPGVIAVMLTLPPVYGNLYATHPDHGRFAGSWPGVRQAIPGKGLGRDRHGPQPGSRARSEGA